MSSVADGVARLKDPRYTGENRCVPCTAVNVGIAFLLALAAELAALSLGRADLAFPAGASVFAASLGTIYLRGYLVPGTPRLTRRYAPAWFLAAFGKRPDRTGLAGDEGGGDDGVEVEGRLLEADALTETEDGRDLRLTAPFRRAWDEEIAAIRDESAGRERLREVLDAPDADVQFSDYGDRFRAYVDGAPVGTWQSRSAFRADVAAGRVLAERWEGWDETPVSRRGRLLNGLRLFRSTCPGCGGDLSFATETVETCCSSREVATLTCDDCGDGVFESRVPA